MKRGPGPAGGAASGILSRWQTFAVCSVTFTETQETQPESSDRWVFVLFFLNGASY